MRFTTFTFVIALITATTLAAGLPLAGLPLAGAADPTTPCLVLEQTVRGVPGMRPGETARQRLTIDQAGRQVLLEALENDIERYDPEKPPAEESPGAAKGSSRRKDDRGVKLVGGDTNRVILRLGNVQSSEKAATILEVDDQGKQFVRRSANLSQLQKERDLMELGILEKVRTLPRAEREKILSDRFLDPKGKRTVEVREGPKRVILGRNCRQIEVTENGRVIVNAWVTSEISGGATFYELYQGLGAFSREVLARLREIHDFPLKATIKVVTAGPTYDISATCTRIRTGVPVKSSAFTLPEGYREVKKQAGIVACPICKNEMEWEEPGGGIIVDPLTKTEYRACSPQCMGTMSARIQKGVEDALKRNRGGRKSPKKR